MNATDDPTRTASAIVGQPSTDGWIVVLATGDEPGARLRLRLGDEVVIGRKTDTFGDRALLDDERLSRKHLELRVAEDGQLDARDLESRNGSFINGLRFERARIRGGEVVGIGRTLLVLERGEAQVGAAPEAGSIVGRTDRFLRVLRSIRERVAAARTHVLSGEVGVGTSTLAAQIHTLGGSGGQRFVVSGSEPIEKVREVIADPCATLVVERIEAQPSAVVEALLGALASPSEHARLVVCTGSDFDTFMSGRRVPLELASRLAGGFVRVPALRERRSDIPLLARAFLERAGGQVERLQPELVFRLLTYPWPGNLHQLDGVIERCVSASEPGVPVELPPDLDGLLDAAPELGNDVATANTLLYSARGDGFSWGVAEPLTPLRPGSPAARVLAELVGTRERGSVSPLRVETLLARVWPNETLVGRSGRNRLYVALTALRKAGLSAAIERVDDGYRLLPRLGAATHDFG